MLQHEKLQQARQQLHRLLNKLTASLYTSKGMDLQTRFKYLDQDRDGQLTWEEFSRVMRRQGVKVTETAMQMLFEQMDVDNSGAVDFEDFEKFMKSHQRRRRRLHRRKSFASSDHQRRISHKLKKQYTNNILEQTRFKVHSHVYLPSSVSVIHISDHSRLFFNANY